MLDTRQGQLVIRLDGQLRDSFTGHGTAFNEPEENPEWPLMDFVGIQDKNGKDIYEGDIVKHPYGRAESGFGVASIGFDDMYCGYSVQNSSEYFGSGIMQQFGSSADLEVIGNLFENPEIVEKYPKLGRALKEYIGS